MSFKVTIVADDGEVLDELTCDCIAGAMHAEGYDDYQSVFYADCDALTALHTLRAAMQTITDNMDDDIMQAAEDDSTQIVEEKTKGVN